LPVVEVEKGKPFFFEKKNQKTFGLWRALPARSATASQKFFASFFQKKKCFLALPSPFRRNR
jgi:hypothetical protein